jgi:hypothetical protein
MKITQFKVMDPLDWGVRDQPYLVVTIDEPLRNPKEKTYEGGFDLLQYGPFVEFVSPEANVGRFNTLDPSHHSMRLIDIQLSINGGLPQPWRMDLKRARAELKKSQRVQDWAIRLNQYHTEQTGEALYYPVKLDHVRCGGWWPEGEVRCSSGVALTLVHVKGRPIFFCKEHIAEFNRDQFSRRVSA